MKRTLSAILTLIMATLLVVTPMAGCTPASDGGEGSPTPFGTTEPAPKEESIPAESPEETPEESVESTPEETPEASTPEETEPPVTPPAEDYAWTVGFGSEEIALPEYPETPLYIAGYNQGVEITDVHDLQRANAIWLDAEDTAGGILIISIDCVGLASAYVKEIRDRLSDFVTESGCEAINVVSTHTHAGLDTFGLWGPQGVDGKNDEFMENLVEAAVKAAKKAYEDRSEGTLHYSFVTTDTSFLRDSRYPVVMDKNLYQLRFESRDDEKNGIRMIIFGAHAESMRGANTILSRDYPGELSDIIFEKTGDDMLYLPGPIGGLVMTEEFVSSYPFDAVKNLEITGKKLADYLFSIKEADEIEISSQLSFVRESLEIPVENGAFKLYKELGILDNEIYTNGNTVSVKSELNLISLGGKEGILFGLIPGEIFPELVSGTGLKSSDPTALAKLAMSAGYKRIVTVNLANDELGYIVPPSDFIVHPTNPYFQRYEVNGEDHYEETNSVGKQCAVKIAEAFESALNKLG